MPATTKVNREDVLAAIAKLNNEKGSKWLVSDLADLLGVSYGSIYNYRHKWQAVDAALTNTTERRKDWGESLLFRKMEEGDTACIIFYAKTQLKDRGYIERQELGGPNNGPLKVLIEYADDPA